VNRREVLKMAGSVVLASGSQYLADAENGVRDPVTIAWNFDGGNLARAERTGPESFRCHLSGQVDQDGRNRQASWYFFRADHTKNRLLTLTLVDLAGEYNYQPNNGAVTKNTPPFYSEDRIHWKPVEELTYDELKHELAFSLRSASDQLWFAHVPPYTLENFNQLTEHLAGQPDVRIESVGKSVEGRDIPLITIAEASGSAKERKVIWLMFRQHAWESGSSWTGDGLMRYVVSSDPVAQRIRRKTTLKILPMCDPDGVVHGGVRFNRYGYDLNRNWDVVDPIKMPEITAERRAIFDWVDKGNRIDFFLSLHNDEQNEYIEGPPDQKWFPLLQRMWDNWSASPTFAPTEQPKLMSVTTTEGKPGRMNVAQGLSHERGLPAFVAEMMIWKHPKLGHVPNIEDRLRAGKDLIQAAWRSI
jgi:Zinc carboxypeptidase/Cytosolic carboxypeptidase N-terminal domain